MTILYLGLDPSRYVHEGTLVHYPIIRTIPVQELDAAAKQFLSTATHFLFTSRTAVQHWFKLSSICKESLAIGPATAAALQERGFSPQIAPVATQEGMVQMLHHLPTARFFWPRSSGARPFLANFLGPRVQCFDLYKTVAHCTLPLPDLAQFDEIVFTSPSTVEAFIALFGALPRDKKLTPIGPVTRSALLRRGGEYEE